MFKTNLMVTFSCNVNITIITVFQVHFSESTRKDFYAGNKSLEKENSSLDENFPNKNPRKKIHGNKFFPKFQALTDTKIEQVM